MNMEIEQGFFSFSTLKFLFYQEKLDEISFCRSEIIHKNAFFFLSDFFSALQLTKLTMECTRKLVE